MTRKAHHRAWHVFAFADFAPCARGVDGGDTVTDMDDPHERAQYEQWQRQMHNTLDQSRALAEDASTDPQCPLHGHTPNHDNRDPTTVLARFLAGESVDTIAAALWPGALASACVACERALRDALSVLLPSAPLYHVSIMAVCEVVAHVYGVDIATLKGGDPSLTVARGVLALVAHEHGHTYRAIAAFLGGRDHSTIMHARDKARTAVTAIQNPPTPASLSTRQCLNAVRTIIQLRIQQANQPNP